MVLMAAAEREETVSCQERFMRGTRVASVVVVILSLAACRNDAPSREAALGSLTAVAFSPQYTSAFWDVERTDQSTC